MYQALYRKWRPRTFDDVVGQEFVTETLKNQIITGRLSHAYLFIGTRGTGKTTCAKILARAVNCEHPENGNPCNKCRSCLGIEDGSIMDVVELDAASNNGVDNVRALRDEAVFSPALVKKRVYIIDEVHMLSVSAFNALLKILEEPPEHLMFILATTELNKIPATILSRCQRHSFRRIDTELMARRISYIAQQENMDLDDDAAQLLARLADGSMRDGLSLLDQCSGANKITVSSVLSAMGLAGNARIAELLDAILSGNAAGSLTLFSALWRDGKDPSALLIELNSLLRDILVMLVAPKGGVDLLSGAYDVTTLKGFASRLTSSQIMSNIDTISSRIAQLRDGRDPRIAAELCIVSMCEPVPTLVSSPVQTVSAVHPATRQESIRSSGTIDLASSEAKLTSEMKCVADDSPPWDSPEPSFGVMEPIPQPNIPETPVADSVESSQPLDEVPTQQAPDDVVAAPAVSQPDNWCMVLEELFRTVPPFVRAHFEGSSAEFSDSGVVIFVSDDFKRSMLDSVEIKDTIKSALKKVTGRSLPIEIKVSLTGASSDPINMSSSLDDLKKFGVVTYE